MCSVAKSCPILCVPVDCSLPGFSVHRSFQARILKWVAISFFRGSSWPRDQTHFSRGVSCIGRHILYHWSMWEAHLLDAAAKSLQSCLTLCDPIDDSPPGSPVPGILIRWVFFKRYLWSFLPVILWKHFTFPPLSTVGILGNYLEYRFFNYSLIFRNKNPEDNYCEITGEYDQNAFLLIMCFSLHLDSLKSNI